MFKAIENGTQGVLLFKNNVLFAKGRIVTKRGSDVGVRLDEAYYETIPLDSALNKKHVFLHFSEISGSYLGSCFMDTPEIDNTFEDVIAVDAFYFKFGMVPEEFKKFPGYGSSLGEGHEHH